MSGHHVIPRSTIFGRATITRNDLLEQLDVDGDGRVTLREVEDYVNKATATAQKVGWYKFAALFGFIVIIIQAFATFGVAVASDGVTRQLYSKLEAGSPVLENADGTAIMATGFTPGEVSNIYERITNGDRFSDLQGVVYDSNGAEVGFDFEIAGMMPSTTGITLYTQVAGTTIVVTKDGGLTLHAGGQTYTDAPVGDRRRLRRRRVSCFAGVRATNRTFRGDLSQGHLMKGQIDAAVAAMEAVLEACLENADTGEAIIECINKAEEELPDSIRRRRCAGRYSRRCGEGAHGRMYVQRHERWCHGRVLRHPPQG